jgi:hypothetical protein
MIALVEASAHNMIMIISGTQINFVGRSKLFSIFEKPKVASTLFSFLDKSDSRKVVAIIPSSKFGFNSIYNPSKCTYKQVQDKFRLYNIRSKLKATPYALYRSFEGAYLGNNKSDDSSINFLIMIPVPFRLNYVLGMDRSPLDLVELYLQGINALNGASKKLNLEFINQRVRIILLLNAYDDHFNNSMSTDKLQRSLVARVNCLNRLMRQRKYPAYVISTLWGLESKSSVSVADCVREYLSFIKLPSIVVSPSFPFAKIRLHIFNSKVAKAMYNELGGSVYMLTADADAVSLNITGSIGLFEGILQQLRLPNPPLRMGGGYGFLDHNIKVCIRCIAPLLDEYSIKQSLLMTQLLQGVDAITRKWLFELDPLLAYMSEANTFYEGEFVLNSLISQLEKSCSRGPDIGPIAVSVLRRLPVSGRPKQKYCWQPGTVLQSSARNDVVLVVDKDNFNLESCNQVKPQILNKDELTMVGLRKVLRGLHNHQCTPGQMSSRFANAGWGRCFHDVMDKLPISKFPHVVYLFTQNRTARKHRRVLAKEAMVEVGSKVTCSHEYSVLRSAIRGMVKHSNKWRSKSQYDLQKGDLPSNKFKSKKSEFLGLMSSFETFLRWVSGMMEGIAKLKPNEGPVSSLLIKPMGAMNIEDASGCNYKIGSMYKGSKP